MAFGYSGSYAAAYGLVPPPSPATTWWGPARRSIPPTDYGICTSSTQRRGVLPHRHPPEATESDADLMSMSLAPAYNVLQHVWWHDELIDIPARRWHLGGLCTWLVGARWRLGL